MYCRGGSRVNEGANRLGILVSLPDAKYWQEATVFSTSMSQWSHHHGQRGMACDERLNILRKAIQDIKKVTFPCVSSKSKAITGPAFQQHYNVHCFLKLQAFQEKQALL